MNDEKDTEDPLDDLIERFLDGPRNTPEQVEESRRNREALRGTIRQWALMKEDGTIATDISQTLLDGTRAHGSSSSAPADADYEALRSLHKLTKPGDDSTVYKRLVEGVWTVVDDLDQQI